MACGCLRLEGVLTLTGKIQGEGKVAGTMKGVSTGDGDPETERRCCLLTHRSDVDFAFVSTASQTRGHQDGVS